MKMGLIESAKSVFSQYAVFEGRARRSEYWMFTLFNMLLGTAAMVIGFILSALTESGGPLGLLMSLYGIYSLAALLPGIAVTCRRFHDVNKPGAYMLFAFLPVVGGILMLVWLIQDSDPGSNRYGEDPKTRRSYTGGTTGTTVTGGGTTVKSKVSCPHCGAKNYSDAVYCTSCGKKLHEYDTSYDEISCGYCHKKIKASSAECPYCGRDPRIISDTFDVNGPGPGKLPETPGTKLKLSDNFHVPHDLD